MMADQRDLIVGHNDMVNRALYQRLPLETRIINIRVDCIDSELERYIKPGVTRVYFTGGPYFGSKIVREKPADVCWQLSAINQVIHACHEYKARKMLFVSSACVYPPVPQPIREDIPLGKLDHDSAPAGLPRLLGMKLCQFYREQYGDDFIVAVPASVYGPFDNFSRDEGHALSSLIKVIYKARLEGVSSIECWGTGQVCREWLYVGDLAEALTIIMEDSQNYTQFNIGPGSAISMAGLVEVIQEVLATHLKINWNSDVPEGAEMRLLDSTRLRSTGWSPTVDLREGIRRTFEWYLSLRAGKADV